MKSIWRFLTLFVLLSFVLTGSLYSQAQVAGSIGGTVTDASGGVIPGAEVQIINQNTNETRTVITDDSGFYTAPNVPVGVYTVTVSMPGFKTAAARDNKVDIRSNRVINITLEVGQVSEEITVEGVSAAQVELRSGEVSNLISGEQATELPLNGRSFVQLSLLVPGAAVAQGAKTQLTGLFAGVDISFSGSASNANMWLVDGTNNVDIGSGRTILTYPSVDSIGEFKISRNMYGADAAASSGAQINVVTKSGTNQFHGTVYEFYRGDVLNATNFFLNSAGQEKQPLVFNNFGYTVGGPVVKDKVFFFWSQEWRRERRGIPRQNLVPTLAERKGDFSGPNSRFDDPIDPLTGSPFPNNTIPADRLSPAGQAMMRLYPTPTISPGDSTFQGFNWIAAPSSPIDTRQEQVRVDYVISDKHSVMGRLTRDSWTNASPSFIEAGLWGDDPFPAVDSAWDQPGHSLSTQWTTTFGPSAINQFGFSWSGNEIKIARGTGDDIVSAINSAIPEVFPGPEGHGHVGFWGDPLGNDLWNQAPWQNEQDLFVWKDDFSLVKGDHSLKMGFLISNNRKDEDIDNNSSAFAPFFWGPTAVPGGAGVGGGWGPPNALGNGGVVTGNGLADLLLKGTYWGGGTETNSNPRSKVRWRDYEIYFNDTWRATSGLTLNYGVRWSFLPNPWQGDNEIANFIPQLFDPTEGATSTNGLIFPGNLRGIDVDNRSLVRNHYADFAPRFGFAWDPTGAGKWAIRGGAGVFFNREAISDVLLMIINPPFRTTINFGNGRPLDSLPTDSDFSGGEGVAQRGKSIKANTPGSYQWNLTVERELWKDTKIELAYVANRGHHIPTQFFINQVPPSLRTEFGKLELNPNTDGDPLRPFFSLVGASSNPLIYSRSADSWYHSFQLYLVKRFSNRLSYQVSYTVSKLLSTAGGLGHVGGNTISDPTNVEYDKGRPDFDRPQIFTTNVIYKTPTLEGSSALARGLLGNWETAVIFTANSGRPETVSCCSNFIGTQSNRPDQILSSTKGAGTAQQWFNPDAFAPPSEVGRLGRSARGQIRGPGLVNFDISVMKNFRGIPWFTPENATLQFRAEFFNAFNHTQFQFVDTNFSLTGIEIDDAGKLTNYEQTNTNFGKVTTVRDPREIQFGLKIIW
ncbi:MAG: carboxypeptidase regulatory-like domain-containing protein [Acidobacteriota bacterium]